MSTAQTSTIAAIASTLARLHAAGDTWEIRAPRTERRGTVSGYYSDPVACAKDVAASLDGKAPAVYVTINPVTPDVAARAYGRLRDRAEATTGDSEIARRRWLPLDFDPVRPTGISSTDAEHDAALARAKEVAATLTDLGWPEPVRGDSGNGAHLLYRVDLPNDDESRRLIEQVLRALAAAFADPPDRAVRVTIDTAVGNAARIWKLYPTWVCKGDSLPERPHRRSGLLAVPEVAEVVTREHLIELCDLLAPAAEPDPSHNGARPTHGTPGHGPRWVDDAGVYLREHGIAALERPAANATKWVLDACVWNPEHTDHSAWVMQFTSNGAIAAGCSHNRCQGKNWLDFRDAVEPGWRGHGQEGKDARDEPHEEEAPAAGEKPGEKAGRGPSIAAQLVALAEGVTFFHDAEQTAWATIPVGIHQETWQVHSRGFKLWLEHRLYQSAGKTANPQAINEALGALEGRARFDGAYQPVFVRLAEHDEAIYLDLGDEEWRAVKVTARGWQVVTRPPVKFRRPKGMLPLPVPARGGSVDLLRPFVNVGGDDEDGSDGSDDWVLLLSWLVAAFRPVGRYPMPYPILDLNGEMGSAKTTTARLLRALIDPNGAPVRAEPKEARDLAIAANNSWVVALDNLSQLPGWLSNALSRLSTGGGFATRTLYENDEESIFYAQRPVILTGIADVATAADLMDRAIPLTLPPIPEHERRAEAQLWRDFEAAAPLILGALLDVVAGTLAVFPAVRPVKAPRMADFAQWATAAERAMGWEPGRFAAAYRANRRGADATVLESSAVGEQVQALMATRDTWIGTATELHRQLTALAGETVSRSPFWPKSGRGLSGALKHIAPNLRRAGIDVQWGHRGDRKHSRIIAIQKMGEPASEPSEPSARASANAATQDAMWDESQQAESDARSDANRSSDANRTQTARDASRGDSWDADASDGSDAQSGHSLNGDHIHRARGHDGHPRREETRAQEPTGHRDDGGGVRLVWRRRRPGTLRVSHTGPIPLYPCVLLDACCCVSTPGNALDAIRERGDDRDDDNGTTAAGTSAPWAGHGRLVPDTRHHHAPLYPRLRWPLRSA